MVTNLSLNKDSHTVVFLTLSVSFFMSCVHNGQEVLAHPPQGEDNESLPLLTMAMRWHCLRMLPSRLSHCCDGLCCYRSCTGPTWHTEDNFTFWMLSSSKMVSTWASKFPMAQFCFVLIPQNNHLPRPQCVMEALERNGSSTYHTSLKFHVFSQRYQVFCF